MVRAWDLLEVRDWRIAQDDDGVLRVDAGLPDQVKNMRGQLFGGFTGTYVDIVALLTVTGPDPLARRPRRWLATASMHIDYFEPITGPRFLIESHVEKHRGRSLYVVTKFFQGDELAVSARTTVRETARGRPVADDPHQAAPKATGGSGL